MRPLLLSLVALVVLACLAGQASACPPGGYAYGGGNPYAYGGDPRFGGYMPQGYAYGGGSPYAYGGGFAPQFAPQQRDFDLEFSRRRGILPWRGDDSLRLRLGERDGFSYPFGYGGGNGGYYPYAAGGYSVPYANGGYFRGG